MINVEHSIIINRPIEEVFAYVSDLRHSAEWQTGLLEVRKKTEGPLHVGTEFAFVRKFLGKKLESSNRFIEYKPNSLVTFEIPSGPVPGEASYLFESAPEGSKVTSKIEIRTEGFSRLAEPLVAASLRRDVQANLGTLKNLLESRVMETQQKVGTA
jgi:uncharacterized membrane protein